MEKKLGELSNFIIGKWQIIGHPFYVYEFDGGKCILPPGGTKLNYNVENMNGIPHIRTFDDLNYHWGDFGLTYINNDTLELTQNMKLTRLVRVS